MARGLLHQHATPERSSASRRVRPAAARVAILFVTVFAFKASAYQEAPMLAERVAAGLLPSVEQRLPENPAVIEPVNEIGVYGGTWRRLAMGPNDVMLDTRLGYESIVQFGRDGVSLEPGLAESWETLNEGRTYVFHLRRGVRWSDGAPLTSEDFRFYFDDFLDNRELTPVYPSWLVVDGERGRLDTPDPYTLVFTFSSPYGIFLEMMAYYGGHICLPKHYLSQFLPKYTPKDQLERMAAKEGLKLWTQLFWWKANYGRNTELPSWRPYIIKTPYPASRMVAERNPYYWKVDPAGNQLPYIDAIAFTDVQNGEIITVKAMAGEADFQDRRIDASSYSLFMKSRGTGNYRVMRDTSPCTIVLYVNQHSHDSELRPILQDRRFRVALSMAIDREELIYLLYAGLAVPSRGVASPYDPYYLPEFDEQYLDYDPDRANRLLEEIGLRRAPNGVRLLPSGRPFRQMLSVFPSEEGTSVDLWQLVAEYFREIGLEFIVKTDAPTLSRLQATNGNSDFWAYSTSGVHWAVDPQWYVPWGSTSFFAPLYGRYQASGGKDKMGVRPPEEFQRLIDTYLALRAATDPERKLELGHSILRQWSEECYTIGVCRQQMLTIVSNRFRNVPDTIIHDWRVKTPGYIRVEQFYLAEEE